MNYVNLGKTGAKVSQLCFGTMSFGAEADEEMSGRMFQRCREAGINFFDCADAYGKGTAETILGRLLDDFWRLGNLWMMLSNRLEQLLHGFCLCLLVPQQMSDTLFICLCCVGRTWICGPWGRSIN